MASTAEIGVSIRKHQILLEDNCRYQKDCDYKDKTNRKCVEYKSSCRARLHTVEGWYYFDYNLYNAKKLSNLNSVLRSGKEMVWLIDMS